VSQKLAELPEFYSVFAGRAVRVTAIDKWVFETTIAVDRSWRGIQAPSITVRSDIYMLGPVLKEGEGYLVFAYRTSSPNWLKASGCGMTTTLNDAGPWLKVLGKPQYTPPGR
jgi:hypothetical protein